jgi:MFS family permease
VADSEWNQGGFVRRNFILNVLDGAVFMFGLSFASRAAVLPVFVKRIGGDNIALGLIPVLWILGFHLPQILMANYAQRAHSKKRLLLKTSLVQRLPWLLLAVLTATVISSADTTLGLILFFVGFGIAAVGGSLNLPVWFDLVAKITPVRLRGRLFGLRSIVGSALGLVAGWVVERVLESMAYPSGFATLFGLAFAAMMISYVFLTLLKEGDLPEPAPRRRYREFLARLPQILRSEQNFRRFIVAEILLVMATTVEAFFAVDAFQKFDLSVGFAGRFTAVAAGSVMVGNFLFGYLTYRFGHNLTLVTAAILMSLACVIAQIAPTVEVYYLVFVFTAFTLGIRSISQLAIIAELCREEDRPTFVALTNALTAPFVLAGLGAGWLANQVGYDTVFIVAGSMALAAAAWLVLMVREPRELESQTNPVTP